MKLQTSSSVQRGKGVMFLETTIQAERATQHPDVRRVLNEFLSQYRLVTSTYVLGEYKSTFLKDATVLYNLLVDSKDTGTARHRFQAYQDRRHKRLERLFNLVTEDEDIRKDTILPRVERLVEKDLVEVFYRSVAEVSDVTGCRRAEATPVRSSRAYHLDVSCRQYPKPSCRISSHIAENLQALRKAVARLGGHDHETHRLRKALRSVLSGHNEPHGNICRTISDLIIATEVPHDAKLATTNQRHFTPPVGVLRVSRVVNPFSKMQRRSGSTNGNSRRR